MESRGDPAPSKTVSALTSTCWSSRPVLCRLSTTSWMSLSPLSLEYAMFDASRIVVLEPRQPPGGKVVHARRSLAVRGVDDQGKCLLSLYVTVAPQDAEPRV